MSVFSERINDIMNKRHITQKQLAEMANVTESAMSYYANGARTPRISVLSRLAGVLGVTTDYLLGADAPEPQEESPYLYLERNLAKLNPEQIDKAERILRIVFEDVFDEHKTAAVNPVLRAESDFLYAEDDPAAKEPFALRSIVDVVKIDETGITFTDGFKIDFHECTMNMSGGSSCCVAGRNVCKDPPFLEFLTSGRPTRLIFCSSRSLFFKKTKPTEMLRELQLQIEGYGYRTYDLT